jgi:hypothetical protein
MSMSMLSRWTMGAMASKKDSAPSPVSSRMASASAGVAEALLEVLLEREILVQ